MIRKAPLAAAVAAAIVAIAAGVFLACEKSPKTVRIAGRTVGPDGLPLPGVRVTLEVSPGDSESAAVERVETESDAKGGFSIDFRGHWKRASYRLEARKSGFRELSVENADSLKGPVTLRLTRP